MQNMQNGLDERNLLRYALVFVVNQIGLIKENNMQEFLEKHGYKLWKTETEQFIGVTKHYQRRIDADDIEYEGYPLCACNDKLFINITHYDYTINGVNHTSYTIELVHENKDGEWCDLMVYSLSEQQLRDNLNKYEKNLLDMWKVFAE